MRPSLVHRLAVVLLAACPALSAPLALAGEDGAPPPAAEKEKKPGEKKAGKKAAGKKEGAPGDEKGAAGIPITIKQISTWNKRMRQTYQASNITNLKIILGNVLANQKPLSETIAGQVCFGIACFYKSGFVAQDGNLDEALGWIDKAIANHYLTASDYENLKELDPLKKDPRFISRIKKLGDELDENMRKEFEDEVKVGIAHPGERLAFPAAPGALPSGELMGFKQLAGGELAGRLICLIVTPIHHDGFTKEAPSLERLAEAYKDKIDVCVLFYQVDAQDEARKELTQKYINASLNLKSKTPFKAAIVGRDFVKPLGIPYFPAHFFLNREGAVIYSKNGLLEEKKLEFIFGEQARIAPQSSPPAPAPKAETPPAPKEEPPAPKVEEKPAPKEEAPAPKPEEKKSEDSKPEEKKL